MQKKNDYRRSLEERVAADITIHLQKHLITEMKSDGVYRHWKCQDPSTCIHAFEIVTWPGCLCFTGDMGYYLFQRTNDMIEFMRASALSFGYAAEKCIAHDGRLTEWRRELFDEEMDEYLIDTAAVFDGESDELMKIEEVKQKLQDVRFAYDIRDSKHDAIQAMYESGLWDEVPSCQTYTYHFLWAMHAIAWFCDGLARGIQRKA